MKPADHDALITNAAGLVHLCMDTLLRAIGEGVESTTEQTLFTATALAILTANAAAVLDQTIAPGNQVMVAKVSGILRKMVITPRGEQPPPANLAQSIDRLVYLAKQVGAQG